MQMHSETVDPRQVPKSERACKPDDNQDHRCKVNDLGGARGEKTEGESDGTLTLIAPCTEHAGSHGVLLEEYETNGDKSFDKKGLKMRTVTLSDMSHVPSPRAVVKEKRMLRLAFPERYHEDTDASHIARLDELLTTANPSDHRTFQKIGKLVQNRPALLRELVDRAWEEPADFKLFNRIVSVLAGVGHDAAQDALLNMVHDREGLLPQGHRLSAIGALAFVRGVPSRATVDAIERLALEHYPLSQSTIGRDSCAWAAPTTLGALVSRLARLGDDHTARGHTLQAKLEQHAQMALDKNHTAERQKTWLTALGNTHSGTIVPIVERYLLGDSAATDEGVRVAAVRSISRLPADVVERILLAFVDDSSPSVRAQVVQPFASGHREASPEAHTKLMAAHATENHHEVAALLEQYASRTSSAASLVQKRVNPLEENSFTIPYLKELKQQYGSDSTYIKFYIMAQIQLRFPQVKAEAGVALHVMGGDKEIFALGIQFNRWCVTKKGKQKTRLALLPYVTVCTITIPVVQLLKSNEKWEEGPCGGDDEDDVDDPRVVKKSDAKTSDPKTKKKADADADPKKTSDKKKTSDPKKKSPKKSLERSDSKRFVSEVPSLYARSTGEGAVRSKRKAELEAVEKDKKSSKYDKEFAKKEMKYMADEDARHKTREAAQKTLDDPKQNADTKRKAQERLDTANKEEKEAREARKKDYADIIDKDFSTGVISKLKKKVGVEDNAVIKTKNDALQALKKMEAAEERNGAMVKARKVIDDKKATKEQKAQAKKDLENAKEVDKLVKEGASWEKIRTAENKRIIESADAPENDKLRAKFENKLGESKVFNAIAKNPLGKKLLEKVDAKSVGQALGNKLFGISKRDRFYDNGGVRFGPKDTAEISRTDMFNKKMFGPTGGMGGKCTKGRKGCPGVMNLMSDIKAEQKAKMDEGRLKRWMSTEADQYSRSKARQSKQKRSKGQTRCGQEILYPEYFDRQLGSLRHWNGFNAGGVREVCGNSELQMESTEVRIGRLG